MIFTVFTPTYNRAHLLDRLYHSLCQQTFQDFEWIVVNDGSKDDTDEVVESFIAEKKININYIKQENGGKHRAINNGIKIAKGELFFIADSDDWLLPTTLEKVVYHYQTIKNNLSIGGVCGLDVDQNRKVIGTGLPFNTIDCSPTEIRMKYHVEGDLKEVFKTDVFREFPFPEIEGERFCPEAVVWNRFSRLYKLHYFNEPIYVAEYQQEGLTSSIVRIRMQSPISATLCYKEMLDDNISLFQKIRASINYWRFRFCKSPHPFPKVSMKWYITLPLGYIMHLKDLKTT